MAKNIHTITVKSNIPVVVIPFDEYENMKETIDLLTIYPDLLAELKEQRQKIESGEFITLHDYKLKYKKH